MDKYTWESFGTYDEKKGGKSKPVVKQPKPQPKPKK